jgi:hypothetical protein
MSLGDIVVAVASFLLDDSSRWALRLHSVFVLPS